MDAPYQAAPDVHVLPTNLHLPGADTKGRWSSTQGSGWTATSSSMPWHPSLTWPPGVWVWLTHDDSDHTGSIQRVLEAAPQSRLVTAAFSALRMAT